MKGSEEFNKTIEAYLKQRAFKDPLFAKTFAKPGKSIDECVTYILNTVKKSGNNGFEDNEIFKMAVHYYDEDDIKVGGKISSGHVVVNHQIQLTPEEKAEAKKKAFDQVIQEEKDRLRGKTKKTPKTTTTAKDDENGKNEPATLF